MHINIACDLGYRPMVINDKGNRFCLILLGKATACRTHSFFSRLIRAANPCVHQTGNGPRVTGRCCPLAARGYSRDGKKGLPQIEYGLLTDPAGRPVAVRVVGGNTADPTAFTTIVEAVKDTFKLKEIGRASCRERV